jgi:hypothetical protein
MPVLTYGFNAGALLTQGGWVSFSCLLAGHFLMLVHNFEGCTWIQRIYLSSLGQCRWPFPRVHFGQSLLTQVGLLPVTTIQT